LDIGGANTKACWGNFSALGPPQKLSGCSLNHAIYRDPQGLAAVLQSIRRKCEVFIAIETVVVTMTAELCDVFASKDEGVNFIVEAVESVYAKIPLYIWTAKGAFATAEIIREQPLQAAAANWLASALALARSSALQGGTALWADMGSTTTDLLLLHKGKVLSQSHSDLDRLFSGELLYSGALRTSLDTLCDEVYVRGMLCNVMHEYFACTADVYRYLGLLEEKDYEIPTPDGKTVSVADCARRLARMVASSPQELGESALRLLALQFYTAQRHCISKAFLRLLSQVQEVSVELIVTDGQGSFLLDEVARELQLPSKPWWQILDGAEPGIAATAFCLALLFGNQR
jgi:probable H4MPT-linked C1 transfer pathway protein